jgi:hypothetical protein
MKHLSLLSAGVSSLLAFVPAAAQNTASGSGALTATTTGKQDTAFGYHTLTTNSVGSDNTAVGFSALEANDHGADNTSVGSGALQANLAGASNSALGYNAMNHNLAGGGNVAGGAFALHFNTKGDFNVACGYRALFANTIGNGNTALGSNAGAAINSGSNNIDIGANVEGLLDDTATIRIGQQGTQKEAYLAGVQGQTTASGAAVYIDATGKLGTLTSSRRFKDGIRDMGDMSAVLLSLQPVTYRYKPQIDPAGAPQFGLVAEDVARIDPDLVVRDAAGQPYSVRYEAVDAMLLNEFLKEHQRVGELEKSRQLVEEEQRTIAAQGQQIAAQSRQLEQLEMEVRVLAADKSSPTR